MVDGSRDGSSSWQQSDQPGGGRQHLIQTPRDRAILESQAREKFENRRKNKNRNSRKLDDSLFDMGLFDEDEEEAGLG